MDMPMIMFQVLVNVSLREMKPDIGRHHQSSDYRRCSKRFLQE